MAYKIPVVSPSALAATEQCPRFRPDGEENDAALEGTMLHECLEQLVAQPPGTWMEWIATRELSAEHKGLLEEAAEQLQTIMEPGMQVFTEKKLKPRYRQGKRINQRLRPGAYPELEIETAPGRHGYIDLLLVLSSGIYVVIDYKFERQAKVHDLQLAKYCARVHMYFSISSSWRRGEMMRASKCSADGTSSCTRAQYLASCRSCTFAWRSNL